MQRDGLILESTWKITVENWNESLLSQASILDILYNLLASFPVVVSQILWPAKYPQDSYADCRS